MQSTPNNTRSHPAADALDWNEAMKLIKYLTDDERFRDSMLVASGCFLGLRISDILKLQWRQLIQDDTLTITEKKTGKKRIVRVNPELRRHAAMCKELMMIEDDDELVFPNWSDHSKPITRQRADQILKEAKARYHINTAKVFATHSLRKTFGRRVWLQECKKGRGEQALLLLCDVFKHSSVAITKRYLGIRKEEVLAVYDSLTD